MKLRALRKRSLARMGPVRAITARRLSREMAAVFAAAFEAQANQSRVLAQGLRDMVRRELFRIVLRPIVADLVRSLPGLGSMFAGPPRELRTCRARGMKQLEAVRQTSDGAFKEIGDVQV